MTNLEKIDLALLALFALGILALLLTVRPAHGQWSGWGYPYPPQLQQHRAPAHHARPAPRHHTSKHSTRSAAEWKASIQAQGRAYCRAHPGDQICHHG